MLVSPKIQYFSILGLKVYYYGIIMAFAICLGFLLANRIAKKYYQIDKLLDYAIYLICSGLIGARLYFCLINYQTYFEAPSRIFNLREGGLSIHGAILGGIITLWILSKKYKHSFLQLCDIFAITLPLSQSIGRWGNFFNSEAFGLPTNNFLKLYIAPHFRPVSYESFEYFHPTFLYESVLDILLFFILYKFVLNKYPHSTGLFSGVYLTCYSIIRLTIEPLRVDCSTFFFNIPIPIIASLIFAIVGLYLIKQSLSSK